MVDMTTDNITAIYGLGSKQWGELDPSDRDEGKNKHRLDSTSGKFLLLFSSVVCVCVCVCVCCLLYTSDAADES